MNDILSHYKMNFKHNNTDYEYLLAVIQDGNDLLFEITGAGIDKYTFKPLQNVLFPQFNITSESSTSDTNALPIHSQHYFQRPMEPAIKRIIEDALIEQFYTGADSFSTGDIMHVL